MNAHAIPKPALEIPHHNFALGLWRLADPKISLASFAAIFLGACAAAAAGSIDWTWLLLTLLGIFAIEVAKNASGEIYDFDSGVDLAVTEADRTPFSGGKRVMVDGLLTRRETFWIALVFYVVGIAIGFGIAVLRARAILGPGLIGVILAYQYHAPPLKLSYRGLGELAVGLCYGPLIALGTYLVQVPAPPASVLLASGALGLLISAFLWINEFPDYNADLSAGKNTLVVRVGRERAVLCVIAILAGAFAVLNLSALFGYSKWLLLGNIALIPASGVVRRLRRQRFDTPSFAPVQEEMLLTFVTFAITEGIGFLLINPNLKLFQ